MRFLAVFALMASVAVARPAEANIQASCMGVDRYCNNNGTAGATSCCTPLKCGIDNKCYSPSPL
ncbi:hypothetical protein BDV41DRAFT_580878 [Aspergillus transmontanensis]|uniref:Uncharacterized protein n=1 Tax=Aspergillus transmontanensis TaxID=1034304 RepID=A0A5N6VKP5_9EURO|nr:hypothetical protein BDV41DRAFT_580878 [Aspergillus transmontanensis]